MLVLMVERPYGPREVRVWGKAEEQGDPLGICAQSVSDPAMANSGTCSGHCTFGRTEWVLITIWMRPLSCCKTIWEALAPPIWHGNQNTCQLCWLMYTRTIVKINKQILMYGSLATLFFIHPSKSILDNNQIEDYCQNWSSSKPTRLFLQIPLPNPRTLSSLPC